MSQLLLKTNPSKKFNVKNIAYAAIEQGNVDVAITVLKNINVTSKQLLEDLSCFVLNFGNKKQLNRAAQNTNPLVADEFKAPLKADVHLFEQQLLNMERGIHDTIPMVNKNKGSKILLLDLENNFLEGLENAVIKSNCGSLNVDFALKFNVKNLAKMEEVIYTDGDMFDREKYEQHAPQNQLTKTLK